jgi:2-polyprenyl-3-methyl-5-hydroxy-6-metoxy-1,4-benzoquinol methylase
MTDYTLVKDPLGYFRCDPIPSKDELERLYADEFYTTAKPRYLERQEDDLSWWNAVYIDRLFTMKDILNGKKKPTLMDVGCGGGFFLKKAQRFWKCIGIEPNDVAREYAMKLLPDVQIAPDLSSYGEWVDAIHISEVLEHIPDPLQMLQNCHRMLFDGGAICVVVPNEKIENDALVYPHVFAPPQHINYFGFDSIENLMKQAGFEIVERSSMFPMEFFLNMGLNYINNEMVGRFCHQMRMMFDLSMTSKQRRKFYKEMASAGYGREAVTYGVKR